MTFRKAGLIGLVLALGLSVVAIDAQAKRLGGGRSFGKQSSSVSRDATPPASAPGVAGSQTGPMGAQSAAVAPRQAAPAAGAAAAQPARSRWLAPLAGLAAGIGLAALASHFGFGEGLANFMMVLLIAGIAFFVIRMLLARRGPAPRTASQPQFSYSGVGQEATVRDWQPSQPVERVAPVVRPVMSGSAPAGATAGLRVPPDFDTDGFLAQARKQFVRMQAAFDSADDAILRDFTTPQMYEQLRQDIGERRGQSNRTDVVTLDAQLLGIESDATEHLASVRFSGMLRESDGAPAEAFDEVWNLSKPVNGASGWLLAGVQQLN